MTAGPIYFKNGREWRAWRRKNHKTATEVWVGFHKKATGLPSMTWPEAVDEALCFGWIDGIRQSVDAQRYKNRFTPRKPTSNWSAVNIAKVKALTEQGRMTPAGVKAFEARREERSMIYSYEQRKSAAFDADQMKAFKRNGKAWAFFQKQPPSYRRTAAHWVISAKQEETRVKRLARLIADSAAGERVGPLRPRIAKHDR